MLKFVMICNYCDKNWIIEIYKEDSKKYIKCPDCGESKSLKSKKIENRDIFGYNNKIKEDAYIKNEDDN